MNISIDLETSFGNYLPMYYQELKQLIGITHNACPNYDIPLYDIKINNDDINIIDFPGKKFKDAEKLIEALLNNNTNIGYKNYITKGYIIKK